MGYNYRLESVGKRKMKKYEAELKEAFIGWIDKRHKDKTIATEVGTYDENGDFRIVDVLLANGHTVAFELKSEADNLDRLNPQLDHFIKFYDYVYVVYWREKFTLTDIPETVGVIEAFRAGGEIRFKQTKRARINRVSEIGEIVDCFWRSEMVFYLKSLGLLDEKRKGYLSKEDMKETIIKRSRKTQILKAFRFFMKHRFRKGYEVYLSTRRIDAFTKHKKDLNYIETLTARPSW